MIGVRKHDDLTPVQFHHGFCLGRRFKLLHPSRSESRRWICRRSFGDTSRQSPSHHAWCGAGGCIRHPFRRCEGRPNLLKTLDGMLHSVPVEEDDVRALAKRIGETAAPQDVDLSLMVLADSLGEESSEVVLVSDDFERPQRLNAPSCASRLASVDVSPTACGRRTRYRS